jgi:hypothetical protein
MKTTNSQFFKTYPQSFFLDAVWRCGHGRIVPAKECSTASAVRVGRLEFSLDVLEHCARSGWLESVGPGEFGLTVSGEAESECHRCFLRRLAA